MVTFLTSKTFEYKNKCESFYQNSKSKYPSQKGTPRFKREKARFNRDEYNFNGINRDLSEILS